MQDFEVKYVFGFDPLQQYMVDFPMAACRCSVSRGTWFGSGGSSSPPDVEDDRHQRPAALDQGGAKNWNHMCADCHSTNLQKNYDPATNTYHTTYSEIDVSCEACHGPGSLHVNSHR